MKNTSDIHIHPNFVLRLPRLPLNFLQDFLKRLETEKEELVFQSLFQKNIFCEAIFAASPTLYYEFEKWVNGKTLEVKKVNKLKISLLKYLKRMCYRTTPFGLFAGGGIGQISQEKESNFIENPEGNIKRHTRLDMAFLSQFVEDLCQKKPYKKHLRFFPNSSIYPIGEQWRYVEKNDQGVGEGKYNLSSVDQSYYLNDIFEKAQEGLTITDLIEQVIDEDATAEELKIFIEEIVKEQLLKHELEANISGEDYLERIKAFVKRVETQEDISETNPKSVLCKIVQIQKLLKQLDTQTENTPHEYNNLIQVIETLGVAFDKSKLLQIDSIYEGEMKVAQTHIQEILKVLPVLNNLNERRPSKMEEFVRAFQERYEDKMVPIAEALDPETGIGYLQNISNTSSPLLENIRFPRQSGENKLAINAKTKLLFNKLKEAIQTQQQIVELTDEDLKNVSKKNWDNVPKTIQFNCWFFSDEQTGEERILIKGVGSVSAIRIHTRFASASSKFKQLVKDILKEEDQQNGDEVLAELVHLPASRVGNILMHPHICDYEIPFLAKSTLDAEQQLNLNDLLLKVENGRIRLWAPKLQKYVLPKLCTAHNYEHNSLPIYHFLSEVEGQGKKNHFSFGWDILTDLYHFSPRVVYKNIVLTPATWRIKRSEFEYLLKLKDEHLLKGFGEWRAKYNIPNVAIFREFDLVMYIDFEVLWSVKVFIQTINNKRNIQLYECLGKQTPNIDGQYFNTDYFFTVINNTLSKPRQSAVGMQVKSNQDVKRSFYIGEECLFFKLYTGDRTTDEIIAWQLPQLVNELSEENLIDKWFFIRYNDPKNHLRLRFFLKDKTHCGTVMQLVHQAFEPFLESGKIWNIQMDTYVRELERYGANSIEAAEHIFCIDSIACCHHLMKMESEQDRMLIGILRIDQLMNDFQISLPQKMELMYVLSESFKKEFNADKNTKAQLSHLYRTHKNDIRKVLQRIPPHDAFEQHFDNVKGQSQQHQAAVQEILNLKEKGELQLPFSNLMSSYIHMSLNRLMMDQPRQHELVLYDFLYQYYRSESKRNTATQK